MTNGKITLYSVPATFAGPAWQGVVEYSPGRFASPRVSSNGPEGHKATGWYCPVAEVTTEELASMLLEAAWDDEHETLHSCFALATRFKDAQLERGI